MGMVVFIRLEAGRLVGCRIWHGVRRGVVHKAQTPRMGAAKRNGVDSNGSPSARACLRRRDGWPSENPAISTSRQSPPVRIAAAISTAEIPRPSEWAIRGLLRVPRSCVAACSIVRFGSGVPIFDFEVSFSWSFFCVLLFGFGLSPFTMKGREAGRPVEVAFRRNHARPPCEAAK